jgi:hypothetical protein
MSSGPTLKGPLTREGWAKSADNLGASPFKRDLSIGTTFSQLDSLFKLEFFEKYMHSFYVISPYTHALSERKDSG